MSSFEPIENLLTVPVTKPLSMDELYTIINDFVKNRITFGVSKIFGEDVYEIWRAPFNDEKKTSDRYQGYNNVIESCNETLNKRNFIKIWKHGNIVLMRKPKSYE